MIAIIKYIPVAHSQSLSCEALWHMDEKENTCSLCSGNVSMDVLKWRDEIDPQIV